jgi:drug/metabolite transporter (DMT)-like permease
MATQVVFAAVVVTALICSTVLTMSAHSWMGTAMLLIALVGVLLIGGSESGHRTKADDGTSR